MENIVEVKGLSRDYRFTTGFWKRKKEVNQAVKNITFNIKKGEIFGLLGQNGAGKTTTIKMLIALLSPTKSEKCEVLGMDVEKNRKKIQKKINVIFGGESGVYKRLSGEDNLLYFANLYKIKNKQKKVQELLKLVGLEESKDKRTELYSKGMLEKLQIARGLLNSPELLFMDEPTIGLDALAANKLREIVKELNGKGVSILLTTHYLQEAEELCDRIAIMCKGEIICTGSPTEVICKAQKLSRNSEISTLEKAYIYLVERWENG